MPKVGWVV